MKYLATLVASVAALFISTVSASGLGSCGCNSDDFELQSVTVAPLQFNRISPVNMELQGDLRKAIGQSAQIAFEVRGGGVHETWVAPLSTTVKSSDVPNLFTTGSKSMSPTFYFPPTFGPVPINTEVEIRIVGWQGAVDSTSRIFCIRGKVYLG